MESTYQKNYTIKEWNIELARYGGAIQESSEYGIPVGVEIKKECHEKVKEVLAEDKENFAA
jgi:hypothetical protein